MLRYIFPPCYKLIIGGFICLCNYDRKLEAFLRVIDS